MDQVEPGLLRELVDWRPAGGVLSVYVDTEPSDRGGGWRIALKDGLRDVLESAGSRDERRELEGAAERVLAHFPEALPQGSGRGHFGFVEVGGSRRERWHDVQSAPRATEVFHGPCPCLRPLVRILHEGAPIGVVLAAADQVRLLELALGTTRELHDWDMVVATGAWKERKSERPRDPARGSGVSAAGRDQFDQRLDANRHRFLTESGHRVRDVLATRRWRWLVLFGEEPYREAVRQGMETAVDGIREVNSDLISAPAPQVGERAAEAASGLDREYQLGLCARVDEAVGGKPGAALGPVEVLQVLSEARVHHLILDAARDFDRDAGPAGGSADDATPVAERMIELAVRTDAEITPVEGDAAARLEPHGGVAALLRY
jgi:hypothetical protein